LSAINVLSYRNGTTNAGDYPAETVLTPANVKSPNFGKLFSTPVDGQVYAQPLVVTGEDITVGPQPGKHNVVLVATENDSLYAIDASSGAILWHDSFIDPAQGITTVPSSDTLRGVITPQIGITSTPVIDPTTDLIYVVAQTKDQEPDGPNYIFTLHAINIATGAEALGGPAVIADTIYQNGVYTYVSGPSVKGDGNANVGGVETFNALRANQRAALTLANGQIYIAFASFGDIEPYHGWILGFDASTLQPSAVFNDTPNGFDGGIWQTGAGLAVDDQGNLYVETGVGTFDENLTAQGFPSLGDYGDSVLKLAPDPSTTASNPNANGWGLKVVDYFTPSNQSTLDATDGDVGSGGVTLLPDSLGSAAHPHLLVAVSKRGVVFLIDRDNMGKFDPNADHDVEEFTEGNAIFSSSTLFGSTIYLIGVAGEAKAIRINNGTISRKPTTHTSDDFAYPGATAVVSSHGSRNGIVWVLDRTKNQLRAYSPGNFRRPLYSSASAPGGRDQLGQVVKFTSPVVANGKVYVGTTTDLVAYGLLSRHSRGNAR